MPDDPSMLVETLARTAFGARLRPESRAKLAPLIEPLSTAAGDVIFREGAATPHLGVVVEGRVALRTHVAGRGDVTYSTVEAGDIYGWSALVAPNRAHAAAVSVTDMDALTFDAKPLRDLLEADPALAADVLENALSSLGRRLTLTRMQLLDLFDSPKADRDPPVHGPLSPRLADLREGNSGAQ